MTEHGFPSSPHLTNTILRSVKDDGGWLVFFDEDEALGVFIDQRHTKIPAIGDTVSVWYGDEGGIFVRGLALNGALLFYKEQEEFKIDLAIWGLNSNLKQRQDAIDTNSIVNRRLEELPQVMRDRVDRFENNNPDFWWRFKPYEVECLYQAFILSTLTADEMACFKSLPENGKRELLPNCTFSETSINVSLTFARLYQVDHDLLLNAHGARCGEVTCEEYGCIPRI